MTNENKERMVLIGEVLEPYRYFVLNVAVSGHYTVAAMTTVTLLASRLLTDSFEWLSVPVASLRNNTYPFSIL